MRFYIYGKAVRGGAVPFALGADEVTTSPLPRLLAALLAFTATACASAPLNFSTAPQAAVAPTPHSNFHTACAAVVDLVEARRLSVEHVGGAEAFLSRLLVGDDASAEPDPIERYVESRALASADAALVSRALVEDASAAADRVAVASDAAAAILASRMHDPDVLGRDIAAAERALAASRRAKTFFAAARDALETDAVDGELARLAEATEQLAARADRLAERRWAAMQGEVS